jgi:hypothetical protein
VSLLQLGWQHHDRRHDHHGLAALDAGVEALAQAADHGGVGQGVVEVEEHEQRRLGGARDHVEGHRGVAVGRLALPALAEAGRHRPPREGLLAGLGRLAHQAQGPALLLGHHVDQRVAGAGEHGELARDRVQAGGGRGHRGRSLAARLGMATAPGRSAAGVATARSASAS